MPTLRSAMYAGYNKFDDAKVRIGSWREELALKELTGVTRLAHPKNKAVFNATGVRVLYHTDRSGSKDAAKSTSNSSFVNPESSFVRYSDDESRKARQESLKPSGKKISQNNPRALVVDHGGGEEICSADKKGSASKGASASYYATGNTLTTLWNTAGFAPNEASAQGSFGRSVYPDPLPHHPSLPVGLSDLEASTLMFLKRRVAERARGQILPSMRGLWRLLWPRVYRDAAGKINPREFRQGMATFEVPVTPHELWAVTTAFDTDNSGQISLDKLMRFFRDGGLSPSRRQIVRSAFQRLGPSSAGVVRMDRIRDACDFSNSPAVASGRTSKGQVAEAFVQHFSQYETRSRNEKTAVTTPVVTFEEFQEAFHDIGAAFLVEGFRRTTAAAAATAAVGNESTGVAACDDAEDEHSFRSLVASLG